MKQFVPVMVALCFPVFAFCQDISGLWKGTMYNDSTHQSLDYQVVISKEKGRYSAYSYTTYIIDSKKYFGIKKINVRIAKDGKVVMQDAELVEYNYTANPKRNVLQLNVLDLSNQDNLEGIFVTNSSKDYKGLTGHIKIERISQITDEKNLLSHFKRPAPDNDVTSLK